MSEVARKKPRGEPHVRLYRYELDCPAYRTLSAAARSLLVEMRALFDVRRGDNRVFMSIREMMARCNLHPRWAIRARDELVERGWISVVEVGGFTRKARHATVYALENEAPSQRKGAVPGKAYMRWRPEPEKDTSRQVSAGRGGAKKSTFAKKHGIQCGNSVVSTVETDARKRAKSVSTVDTVEPVLAPSSVSTLETQIPSHRERSYAGDTSHRAAVREPPVPGTGAQAA